MFFGVPSLQALIVFLVAAALCVVAIIASQSRWMRYLTRGHDLKAVQSAHSAPTPRLGGLAVMFALGLGGALVFGLGESLWMWLMLSVMPLFLSGLSEDLGYLVQPAGRLGAALLSASLAVTLTQSWITSTGIGGLDLLMGFAPLAVILTIVSAATISHAFNLIDGLNGLAGFTSLIACIGLVATAKAVGDPEIAAMAFLLAAGIVAFLALNYPFGRIFFGDAGAYAVGFMIAWMGISLAARHDDVTPLAMLLIMFWPLADLLLAIYRRWLQNLPMSHPDRLHFHQLIMRFIEISITGRGRRRVANPVATAVLLPFIAAPMVAGVMLRDNAVVAALAFVAFFGLFFACYTIGVQMASRRTRGSERPAQFAVKPLAR